MGKTSKSPKAVLLTAHRVGRQTLRLYSHLFSPKKFTQPQLFACLVLREFLRLDYRKLSALLSDTPTLCEAIGLEQVPHFTTLQKAHKRLLGSGRGAKRLLDETARGAIQHRLMEPRLALAAIDGTGFESRHVSTYYAKRRRNTTKNMPSRRHRHPKAVFVCDCHSHVVLAVTTGRGPSSDDRYSRPAIDQAARRVRIDTLLADAGYDSEPIHRYARERHGIKTIIPAKRGRPTTKLPTSKWRKRMATHFDHAKYGQRWQVETVNSMIKRQLGSALRSRTYHQQNPELKLRVITHNIMLLWIKPFYRATDATLSPIFRRNPLRAKGFRKSRSARGSACDVTAHGVDYPRPQRCSETLLVGNC